MVHTFRIEKKHIGSPSSEQLVRNCWL